MFLIKVLNHSSILLPQLLLRNRDLQLLSIQIHSPRHKPSPVTGAGGNCWLGDFNQGGQLFQRDSTSSRFLYPLSLAILSTSLCSTILVAKTPKSAKSAAVAGAPS